MRTEAPEYVSSPQEQIIWSPCGLAAGSREPCWSSWAFMRPNRDLLQGRPRDGGVPLQRAPLSSIPLELSQAFGAGPAAARGPSGAL
eukprot:2330713-Alexandrium_andersonii.AAC.1